MSAILVKEYGGVEKLEEGPLPFSVDAPIAAGYALVEIKVAGLNFIDVYYRTGLYKKPQLPYVTCDEGSGVILKLGESSSSTSSLLRVGDRVAFFRGSSGAAATHALVKLEDLYPIPSEMSFQDAAAVLLQGATAHYLTRSSYAVKRGDVVLVQAAAGGTGLLISQICHTLGAIVIGTCSSEDKAKIARSVGKADHVVNYTSNENWAAEVKSIAAPYGGVAVVYDGVGKSTFLQGLTTLKPRGHMITFGNASGPVDPISPLLLTQHGSLTLQRPTLKDYSAAGGEIEERVRELFGWIASGDIVLTSSNAVFPLSDVRSAFAALEGRQTTGKVVLTTTPTSTL
ncbi:quinone oxidoreductase, putative [Bodo saltans]|uniref:Quinone oxidoreductase, putative n=1 Tax=Bodo saltans TaxID=75058 RepID=A0A0S4KHW9_BODSA|nr:quinone oxidoreductase, putative [Bodo saltans]|eukprot:CUI14188.1 quinone oxidoreductase, putative [Bodo saltans]